ncbi:MAG: hypothetical protein ACM3ZT_01010 [Bacillota bacterium]
MGRRIGIMLGLCMVSTAGSAVGDMDLTYRVKVDNLSRISVTFKLDDTRPCTAGPQQTCSWDIPYGSHRLDAYAGDKHYSREFELSDESDIQVHCKFDGTMFSGDSC